VIDNPRGFTRKLYDWTLQWAETPHAVLALIILTIAESSFFPIPIDPLLIVLCLGSPSRSLIFAAIATSASVIGGMIGYGIGSLIWLGVSDFFFAYIPGVTIEAFTNVQAFYENWDFWAVFIAGLTPIPYKVFTISAGVFTINFPVFVLASILSRGLRFFLIAGLIYHFGPSIKSIIDRHFKSLTYLFCILIIIGFFLTQYLV
jgi:membrane protein YqaA with SNARE-associated domain